MGGAPGPGRATVTTTARLKREDFRRTKHDSSFSTWQVLIGPSDWENYEAGKQGAERYRVANLPSVCGPGLYEIGVAVTRTDSGRDVSKLGPDRIVVVYLGQADNVRSRLQHYGRSGSHLVQRRRWPVGFGFEPVGECQGTGLFEEVFSRGYPIVYRWASMKSKSDAERMEAKLLEKFDYAWNKVSNGLRRPQDVLNKMEKISSKRENIPKILRMLQSFGEHKVGIPIKPAKYATHDEGFNLFGRILKFGRSQPRLVSTSPSIVTEESNQSHVCGVTLGNGSTCDKQPVEGRKRCVEHKGMRLTKNLIVARMQAFPHEKLTSTTDTISIVEDFSPICGVIQHDGSPCAHPPFPGRKRCEKHKGMRVKQTVSKPSNASYIVNVELSNLDLGDYCGVNFGDGNFCRRQPVKGRKRCAEHKGMRVDAYICKLSSIEKLPT